MLLDFYSMEVDVFKRMSCFEIAFFFVLIGVVLLAAYNTFAYATGVVPPIHVPGLPW